MIKSALIQAVENALLEPPFTFYEEAELRLSEIIYVAGELEVNPVKVSVLLHAGYHLGRLME